ncbi:MAG: hypothetical protein CMN76_11425 [Spirochaetaceae bacterium]|nr:hypothetical protein [Spirochaetaceae bacterium]|tara:strand:- start:1075 stop:1575 length:501 start_codon:yes stop_codon:yes gene_type:complete
MVLTPLTAEGYRNASPINDESPELLLASDLDKVGFEYVGGGRLGAFMHGLGWLNFVDAEYVALFRDILGTDTSFVECWIEDKKWFAIYPHRTLAGLDLEQSSIIWREDGKGLLCERAVFNRREIDKVACFILSEFPGGPLLINGEAGVALKKLNAPGLHLILATHW